MFLHNRNATDDFVAIVNQHRDKIVNGGVVHSFTGSLAEAKRLLDLGFYIGINGCSLKTEDNLKNVTEIPLDRLMVETDCPW